MQMRQWPTLLLIVACSLSIMAIVTLSDHIPLWLNIAALAVLLVLHSSLQHEVLHGHPFRHAVLNESLVFVPFGIFISYRRFRDTHLQHHIDEYITDPYEDPESQYMDPAVWHRLPVALQLLLKVNGTLSGRLVLGPLVSLVFFYRADIRLLVQRNRDVINAYQMHLAGLLIWCLFLFFYGALPVWAYLLACYMSLSLLGVRTYLEHQAHQKVQGRTVIIEDRGLLAFLFLYNNFHLVHHVFPKAPWYRLPAMYKAQKDYFLLLNEGYCYPNYRSIIVRYFFRRKEPIAHPLSRVSKPAS